VASPWPQYSGFPGVVEEYFHYLFLRVVVAVEIKSRVLAFVASSLLIDDNPSSPAT
jgi:hypothetical protein